MHANLFGSDLWKPALDKYAEATGLAVQLFGLDAQVVLASTYATPLTTLLREYSFEPGLFAECARRCLEQTKLRPAVIVHESHGLTVVGTSLVLDGVVAGAAVAGYALAGFVQVSAVRRWAQSAAVPFDRLWHIVRKQAPVPERRLMLHGELLQVLGDALLRENHRTRQYEQTVVQLEAASTAKDDFLAVLSHELRTPLTPILGWASILKKSAGPEQLRAAEAIERNALLQSRMVDDLLDMARVAHGTMKLDLEILDLPAMIRTALEASARHVEKKSIRLELAQAGEPLLVQGDAGRLQQVFRNILSNAVKFTPSSGAIRVALSRENESAVLVVSDTGVGIAPEFLPFVFDMFRQQEQGIRRAHEGLGIGFSLVKRLVEIHKGTVEVTSAGTGCGTEVTVRLPLAAEIPDLDDAAPAAAELSASALAGLSLLIVEDSEDSRDALSAVLKQLGAEVLLAADGREALEVVDKMAPDLVLCDLRMPVMDGFQFVRELHRAPVSPPVVAISGLASDADRERTREAGFDAHIKKPFDEATVAAAVAAALRHRHERRAAPRNAAH